MKTLILGGVRSGKSGLAEQLAAESTLPVTYIATAQPHDDEMQQRIAAHRARRPPDWTLIEEPLALGTTLARQRDNGCIVVECLTLWLTNLLLLDDMNAFARERWALFQALAELRGELILVGNETNMGVTPADTLSRRYCDEAGRLHQDLAQRCDRVLFTAAGLPLALKGNLP